MTWQYAIREWRIVELFHVPGDPEMDGAYCVMGWRDIPHLLHDWRWVIRDCWSDWR